MSNKGKKSARLCFIGAVFYIGVLFIFLISNITSLIDLSNPCPPTWSDGPQFKDRNTEEFLKESDNPSKGIIEVKTPIKVTIGTVVCHKPDDLSPREEALVLLKSTIISAILYQTFPINIEFHLFLEHTEDEKYFLQNIQPFAEIIYEVQVNLVFYSVFEVVPKEYSNLLFDAGLRCAYVRIFFPDALSEVDSVLYLDTDVIITGNLGEIWDNFYKMGDHQLVGAVMDMEPENIPWFSAYTYFFRDDPVPTPRGLNSGVLLMNLTKMRKYQFGDKFMRLYKDYSVSKNDQSLLNVLLFYNPYLLYLLPCQYNFRQTACTLGFYCSGAIDDPTGVQILHNYQPSDIFKIDNAFRDIAEAYQNIIIPDLEDIANLMTKVRNMYQDDFKSSYDHGKCNGALNNLLFKKLFV